MSANDEQLKQLGITKEDYDGLSPEEKTEIDSQFQPDPEKPAEPASAPAKEPDDKSRESGILAELQETRRKLREIEAERDGLRRAIPATPAEPAEPEPNDEDIVNVKTGKRLVQASMTPLEERLARIEFNQFQAQLKNSEEVAKDKFSEAKVGKELEYTKVIREGLTEILKANPAYRLAIQNSPNPAEEGYRIGLLHPKFQQVLTQATASRVVDDLNKARPVTGKGGGAGGGIDASSMTVEDLMKLSDAELEKLARAS